MAFNGTEGGEYYYYDGINGTNGDDQLFGTQYVDEINGLNGNDMIRGSLGADQINGGEGIDTIDYSTSFTRESSGSLTRSEGRSVHVDLFYYDIQSGGFAEGDHLFLVENVGGSGHDDEIRGDGENNLLVGNGGDDLLEGRAGDDRLFGDGSLGYFYGVEGDDVLDGGAGNDELFGGGGNDTLIGGTGSDKLSGGDGTDTASYAGSSSGMIISIANSSGVALTTGSTDQLVSIENIVGSNFADAILGSSGINVLDGGAGNDTIVGGAGADTLKGGSGIDTASYLGSSEGVNVNLGTLSLVSNGRGGFIATQVGGTGSGGDAEDDTLTGFENLVGSDHNDNLTGNAGANRLDGLAGDDNISGGGGNDVIIGGSQIDIDRMSGGAGADTFLYLSRDDSRNAANATGDAILDFNVDQDTIDLQALNINAASLLLENAVVNGLAFTRITEDANGNAAIDIGEFSIAVLTDGNTFVTVADILI